MNLDGNGVEELLIGRPEDVMDVFTYNGMDSVRLENRFAFGRQTTMTIMETGETLIADEGNNVYIMHRMSEDRSFMENVFPYQGYDGAWHSNMDETTLSEGEFWELMGKYAPVADILNVSVDWLLGRKESMKK